MKNTATETPTYSQQLLKTLKTSYDAIQLELKGVNNCFDMTKFQVERLESLIKEDTFFKSDNEKELVFQKSELNKYQGEKYMLNRITDRMLESMKENGIHWLALN